MGKYQALKRQQNSKTEVASKPSTNVPTLNEEKEMLEIGLLLDCTSSMSSWIDRAKQTLKTIVDDAIKSCDGKLKVRVCFVGYRDHKDQKRFLIKPFTEDIQDIKLFISLVQALGGDDRPEDVTGGMRKCLDQAWSEVSTKQVFHIFDAPCHGKKYHNQIDDYPQGCPEGLILEDLMKEFKDKDIGYYCIKVNDDCDQMIKIMSEVHNEMEVQDLSIYTSEEDLTQNFQQEAKMAMISNMCRTQQRYEQQGRGRMVTNKECQMMAQSRKQLLFQPCLQSKTVKKEKISAYVPKFNHRPITQTAFQMGKSIQSSEPQNQFEFKINPKAREIRK